MHVTWPRNAKSWDICSNIVRDDRERPCPLSVDLVAWQVGLWRLPVKALKCAMICPRWREKPKLMATMVDVRRKEQWQHPKRCADHAGKPESAGYRRGQFNNFTQLTMPYLAGFVDESRYRMVLIDEYNQHIRYDRPVDLVAITVNTPNACHCYTMAARFRAAGAKVVMGGPHATLCPDEVAAALRYLITGEAEESWPRFLDDFYRGCCASTLHLRATPELRGMPIPRRDFIKRRQFTKGA